MNIAVILNLMAVIWNMVAFTYLSSKGSDLAILVFVFALANTLMAYMMYGE